MVKCRCGNDCGTGINAKLYPRDCFVTGIDLSSSMLEKARDRVARHGIDNVRLLEMDAAQLKFADDSFDIVYAPYLINVVPDPPNGSNTMSRLLDELRIARSTNATGFMVGCRSFFAGLSMNQTSPWSRAPHQ